ncbi:hypothetical protein OROGR_012722 [Orobanche gracilis]
MYYELMERVHGVYIFPIRAISKMDIRAESWLQDSFVIKEWLTFDGRVPKAYAHQGVFGLITKPFVRFLLPSSKELNRMVSAEPRTPNSFTVPLLGECQDSVDELFSGNGQSPKATRAVYGCY